MKEIRPPRAGERDAVSGGAQLLGVYKPGVYAKEAKEFFRSCVGSDPYERAMRCAAGRLHHFVPARAWLSQTDWEKLRRIEQDGTLDNFTG